MSTDATTPVAYRDALNQALREELAPGTFVIAGLSVVSGVNGILFWLGKPIARYGLIAGVLLCITIIGIPFGIVSFGLTRIALAPLGRHVVPIDSLEAGAA